MNRGAHEQSSETQVGQRQYHIEILPHIAVVQEMVAIEPEENAGSFNIAFSRQVHAPVHIFIRGIIRAADERRAAGETPTPQQHCHHRERNHPHRNQSRSVPPSHWNGVFVFFMNEVVSLIRLENVMVNERVPLKRIHEKLHAAMHYKPMKRPFKKRGEDGGGDKSNGRPEEESCNQNVMGLNGSI